MLMFIIFAIIISNVFCQNSSLLSEVTVKEVDIERPCEIFDIVCIRKYFASHSHCNVANGPFPKTLFRPKSIGYFARINLTIIFVDKTFNIRNARIEEFFINKKTDKLVLAVEFIEVEGATNTSYYRYHRRNREPVMSMDFYWDTFSSYVITIIIPNLKNLEFEKSEVYTFVNDATPRFVIGPRAYISSDPGLTAAMANIYTNVQADIQEYYFTESTFFIGNFIQKTICDFGLELY